MVSRYMKEARLVTTLCILSSVLLVAGACRSAPPDLTSYTTADGLVSDYVYALAEAQDGTLWVGTREGVSYYDGETWKNFTEADGLVYDHVYTIAAAPDGAVW